MEICDIIFFYVCREKVVSRKPRRLARSQIPTKPVEMPAGIESLDVQVCFIWPHATSPIYIVLHIFAWCRVVFVLFCALAFVQFGELGIDFVGLESGSPPPPPEQSSEVSLSLSASAAGGDQLSTVDNQLTYSQLQHRYMYISIIIIII